MSGRDGLREDADEGPAVLVVDDDAGVQAIARSMLEDTGFRVLTANGGLEALELFGSLAAEIDAVLLDLTMPVTDGRRVLEEIRRIDPEARVILMSGHSAGRVADRLQGLRSEAFIQKPFSSSDLVRTLRAVLA
jgi:CheY-like chemotaxis protein